MRKILIGIRHILIAVIIMMTMFAVAIILKDFINSGLLGMISGFFWSFGMTIGATLFLWDGIKIIICKGE